MTTRQPTEWSGHYPEKGRLRSVVWTRLLTQEATVGEPAGRIPRFVGADKAAVWRALLLALLVMGIGCTLEHADPQHKLAHYYHLLRPEGSGPFPAVMLVPGCGGFMSSASKQAHFTRITTHLRDLGYLVAHVNYLAARDLTSCHPQVALHDVARDILTTASYLQSLTDVREEAIFVMGWSYGGGGALAALSAMSKDQSAPVRAVVAFYPVCYGVRPWQVNVPVLVQIGAHDEQTPPQACRELGTQLASRQSMTLDVYPEARHSFDVVPLPSRRVNQGRSGRRGVYHRRAATAAWQAVERFLQLHSS